MSIDPHLSSTAGIEALKKVYRDGLLNDTLPFWIKHSVDRKYGGFTICLDSDGRVIDTDKGVWSQGRFTWLLSTLYTEVEQNPEWLELAKHGIDFIRKYGFDEDGRMFFSVTQSGKPLRKRRYIFSESFTVVAFAAYAKASGDVQAKEDALSVFRLMQRYLSEPCLLPPKLIQETRSMKGLAVPMIMIVTAQILREVLDDPRELDQVIDDSINEIERDFMKPEFKAVLESVAPNGDFSDHFDGRMLCPGHAIEAATDFAIPHGIAVSIGCDMANYCAYRLGISTESNWKNMSNTFKANYDGYETMDIPFDSFLSALGKDKKNVGSDSFSLILPDKEANIFKDSYSNSPILRGYFQEFLTGLNI